MHMCPLGAVTGGQEARGGARHFNFCPPESDVRPPAPRSGPLGAWGIVHQRRRDRRCVTCPQHPQIRLWACTPEEVCTYISNLKFEWGLIIAPTYVCQKSFRLVF